MNCFTGNHLYDALIVEVKTKKWLYDKNGNDFHNKMKQKNSFNFIADALNQKQFRNLTGKL